MISPLRRVTLPVTAETMEQSLGYYQQVLGMRTFYDQVQDSEALGALVGLGGQGRARMVVLQQGDSTVGMVGLIQYIKPSLAIPRFDKPAGSPFPLHMIFSAQNVEGIRARAMTFGARVPLPPVLTHYPDRAPVQNMTSFAPTGVWTCTTAFAQGENNEVSVGPLHRVALPVAKGDIEAPVRFYQDVLGMQIYYDAVIEQKAERSTLEVGDSRVHLVSLRQGDCNEGMVGFMEYLEPALPVPKLVREANGPYPVALVFLTDEMDDVYKRAREAAAPIICPPLVWDIPGRGRTREMTFLDPRGVLVNLIENVD